MPLLIGTSGWHYKHWKPTFYPAGMGSARWLAFYAGRFATVEINNAFYRLPDLATFEHWRDSVPGDFVFAVKASRYLTHVKRLRDPEEPVARLIGRARGLGPRLGPILIQLPPNLLVDPHHLDATLAAFKGAVRLAVELRHRSWFVDEVRAVLEERGAALCLADSWSVDTPMWRTADWAYIRLHGGIGMPASCYKPRELAAWRERLTANWAPGDDIYCFFNNDAHGCALRDARRFAEGWLEAGWSVTRVPPSGQTHVS